MATTVSKKGKALELMKRLDIYEPYIEGFRDNNQVCFFERFIGFWDYQEPEIENKRKELEREFGFLIYAVTHEFIGDDEMYSFLYVSKYEEDWKYSLTDAGQKTFYAHAYVWNKSCEWCSEPGTIVIQYVGGGIRRVA